jgi:phosphoglycolate phosphatase
VVAATAVLFDIDGTLIDTGGAGARSWKRAFQEVHGMPCDITRFSEVGMTDPVVARQTFVGTMGREPRDGELAPIIMAYVRWLPDEIAASAGYRVLPGVLDLLKRLAASGAVLGLVSGNMEGAARIKIERAGLNRYFPFGGYGTDSADRTELTRTAIVRAGELLGRSIDPGRTFVVGDTPRDIDAAEGAGATSVAVATGAYTVRQLEEAGADHVLPDLTAPFPSGP